MSPPHLQGIWIKRCRRGPMDRVEGVTLIAGRGIQGNADQGGRRQVTLLSRERWEAVASGLGRPDLDPSLRRANLLLTGVELEASRGRRLRLGGCLLRIRGETRPCERMDELFPGLQEALEPPWAAGAFGEVLEGGELRTGDIATWEDEV